MDDVEFKRTPTGYQLRIDEAGIVLEGRQVRWEHGTLYAVVSVRARLTGVRTSAGDVVTEQRVNLSSDRGRSDVAKACGERSPGLDIDWRGFVEEFAIRALAAEREGQPFETVGQLPRRIDPGFTFVPYIPRGMPVIFYGPGGAGKGYLVTALAVSHATGVEVIPGYAPRGRGNVLYLDWESDKWDIDDRVKRIAAGLGIEPPTLQYRECVQPFVDQIDDITREVHRGSIDFLVIDSSGMAMSSRREGGDANESTRAMFQAIRPLRITTALVDHVVGSETKAGSKSARPYGSVYKENLARNTYEVRPLAPIPGENGVQHVSIRHQKHNVSAALPTLGVAIEFEPGTVRFRSEAVRQVPAEEDTAWPTSTRALIRRLLDDNGHMTPEALADETGRNADSIGRVLRRYGPNATNPRDRWFNRLPSGRFENLPLGPLVEAEDAG